MTRRLIFFLLLSWNVAIGQNADRQMFESICQNIANQNSFVLLRKNLQGVTIVTNPVNGTQNIDYGRAKDNSTVREFKTYSREEQIAILNGEALTTSPLKDTLFIVDTLRFFPEVMDYRYKDFLFVIVRKLKRSYSQYERLSAVGVRNNNLILSFTFPNATKYYNYYFNLKDPKFTVLKTSIVPNSPHFE